MTAHYIYRLMNYILVATEPIVGSRIIKGPITGKDWLITPQGNWVADEFERTDRFLNLEIERYCQRTHSIVKTKIFLVSPSYQQMEQMPVD